jgi:8-oxo-dGTP pyrophosphatase MutT (NUDIX family)
MKDYYCANCGKNGHLYKNCLFPIISLGIILVKRDIKTNELKYLMVQRKSTLGYVEFMRGKYNIDNIEYIKKLFSIMTYWERQKIVMNDFDELWNDLWMDKTKKQYYNEYDSSKKKFYILKMGYLSQSDNMIYDLNEINKEINVLYYSPEWGFPKGRRNLYESDKDCAIREFEEETGIKRDDLDILGDKYYSETFYGTNNIRYKHIYFIARLKDTEMYEKVQIDQTNINQVMEIGNIEWYNFENAMNVIRPYNSEKKDLLKAIDKIVHRII